jgi:hypothetical protein
MRYGLLCLLALALVAAVACGSAGGDILILKIGDCVEDPGTDSGTVYSLHRTECVKNTYRATQVFEVWAPGKSHDEFPGDDFIKNLANLQCSHVNRFYLRPTEDSWSIDHRVICFQYV